MLFLFLLNLLLFLVQTFLEILDLVFLQLNTMDCLGLFHLVLLLDGLKLFLDFFVLIQTGLELSFKAFLLLFKGFLKLAEFLAVSDLVVFAIFSKAFQLTHFFFELVLERLDLSFEIIDAIVVLTD